MKTKRKSLWRFARGEALEPSVVEIEGSHPVGNSIVQAVYSAAMLREEREDSS